MQSGVHPPSGPEKPARGWDPGELTQPGGRVSKGLRLVGASWRELFRARPILLVLPAVSAVTVAAATAAIYLAFLYHDRDDPSLQLTLLLATAATAIPFAAVSTFCNVGFLAMVEAHLRGEQPSLRQGLGFARSRLRTILAWSLLSGLIGGVLGALERIPGADWLWRVLGAFGGATWGLATYFVVPVIVVEGAGVRGSISRSAAVFRSRWGETLTGDLTIGVAFAVFLFPLTMLLVVGAVAMVFGELVLGGILVGIGAGGSTALLAVASALTDLFQLLVYRETIEGATPGPFSAAELADLHHPRARLWPRPANG